MAAANGGASAAAQDALSDLLPDEEDLLYEEELLRNPYALRMWLRYLDARKSASARKRYLLFERALAALPGSYKLWHAYLSERLEAVRGLAPNHPSVEALNNCFERAMVSMHKMPRIWIMYLEFMLGQNFITRTRRLFDRALTSLPVTQHERVWPLYLKFIGQPGIPMETAVRVYRRYLKLEPTHAEEFIAYLKIKQLWGEAARRLADVVNDEGFRSLEGKSKHQLWLELCDLVTKHPNEVKDMKVEAILRSGIRRFTDEVGRLWTSLADYFIRRGMFERARDVYEEGLTSVVTVRDFSLVYDALTQFEESLISAKMEQAADEDEEAPALEDEDGEDFLLKDAGDDLDLRLARLEHLMERRPELLSSVMLRQNPHNVHEWHKRAKLFAANPTKQILCYTEAVKTVDPERAVGKPHTLWVAFAKLYEKHGDLPNARIIFEKGVQARFKYVDDLASVWCEWAEMELRHKNFKRALEIMRRATARPARPRTREEEKDLPVQDRVYRSLKLWSFYVDLEESLGTLDSTKDVYEAILDLRVATPQIVLNYAAFMLEHKFFEEAFRVYERGISLFKYPHVKDIWTTYLTQFVARYGGKKVERARDLFRQAIDEAPAAASKPLFLAYAKYEEEHGLARNAMQIYDAAVKKVPEKERLSVYDIYVARASEFFGIGKVREVYEGAIEAQPPVALSDADTRTVCLRYAALERRLGEVDRARAIYVHGASLADPRSDKDFWSEWNSFEVKHGNEETFREMLRIKRSVAAAFSQQHFNTTVIDAAVVSAGAAAPVADAGKRKREGEDSMAALEAAVAGGAPAAEPLQPGTRVKGFVSAGVIQQNTDGAAGGDGGAVLLASGRDPAPLFSACCPPTSLLARSFAAGLPQERRSGAPDGDQIQPRRAQRPAMPVVAGEGGLPKVVLSSGDASAELYLHGATLTSWKVGGERLIFVSPKAVFAPPKAIRGGVPVCFPQFAMLGPLQAQHGFARNMAWQVAEEGPASCRLVLESDESTLAQWPHPFRLEMAVSLHAGGALQQQLTVTNTGEQPIEFTAALHTYLTVSDVANASVVGLKGLQYVDNTSGSSHTDSAEAVTFPGEVDRTYIGAPAAIKLRDSGRNSVLLLHKRGFADAVVWNPAEAKAASMGDLGAEHWRGFVCVEAAQARSGAVQLAAGQAWSAGVEYEYDHLEES